MSSNFAGNGTSPNKSSPVLALGFRVVTADWIPQDEVRLVGADGAITRLTNIGPVAAPQPQLPLKIGDWPWDEKGDAR